MSEVRADAGTAPASLPQAAAALAYAGALPLILGAMLAWLAEPVTALRAVNLMAVYGVMLLAFFGGIRWGIAVMRPGGPTFLNLLGGVAPMAAAGALYFASTSTQIIALVFLLPVLLIDDLRATRRGSGAPAWYLGVRAPLTVLMELSFVAVLIKNVLGGA